MNRFRVSPSTPQVALSSVVSVDLRVPSEASNCCVCVCGGWHCVCLPASERLCGCPWTSCLEHQLLPSTRAGSWLCRSPVLPYSSTPPWPSWYSWQGFHIQASVKSAGVPPLPGGIQPVRKGFLKFSRDCVERVSPRKSRDSTAGFKTPRQASSVLKRRQASVLLHGAGVDRVPQLLA
jgi:hypothetical protein